MNRGCKIVLVGVGTCVVVDLGADAAAVVVVVAAAVVVVVVAGGGGVGYGDDFEMFGVGVAVVVVGAVGAVVVAVKKMGAWRVERYYMAFPRLIQKRWYFHHY